MPDSTRNDPNDARARDEKVDGARRRFLLLFPVGVFGAIAATLAASAFRFLRPQQQIAAAVDSTSQAQWTEVAPLSELTGDAPLVRKVAVRHDAGWSSRVEERTVFVLPQQNNRVVSAVCPHEGCEVEWRADERSFLCPCHDSRFTADGAPTSGPAVRNLDELPAQVENGVLKIRYQPGAPAPNNVAANTPETPQRG
ncbi:MAG TPA: Rieske 2Fe-2S domain-containing protein [Pyrinomonadaceae bacterium]|nr:Rieske 2Fe-2S domain-containing protein [Pyrinomonadaceae bacterium]